MSDDRDELGPKNHHEEVAMFRASIVGGLVCRDLARGELKAGLERLTQKRFRPPGADKTRTFGFSTLERWYYAYKHEGLAGLMPKVRSDRGHARRLDEKMRELLCEIRRQHPSASVPSILRTLRADGRLSDDAPSASTIRRLFRRRGLTRSTGLADDQTRQRFRWQTAEPMALWQGDVCYAPSITVDGEVRPVRVHAFLDDATRRVMALEAHHTEREMDMLRLFADAIRRHGKPDELYLDNGSTYSGDLLEAVCARLEIGLRHTAAYDPEAKGKIERFFRTLKEQCLDHLGGSGCLESVNTRLNAWLDTHYHHAPHAGLKGRAPLEVFDEEVGSVERPTEAEFAEAFLRRSERKVRKDSTLQYDGQTFEVDQQFLCSRTVDVCRPLLEPAARPFVEMEGRRFALHPVRPIQNAQRKRTKPKPETDGPVDFQPAEALMRRAAGLSPSHADTANKDDQ